MPAVLDIERVRAAVAGTGFVPTSVAQTGSTNDDVRARLGEPGGAGLVLIAEHQTAGRGRKGRAWFAPPGTSLLFTAALPRTVRTEALWAVPFWSALALDDALRDAAGVATRLVWPNDVFLDGRKLAGILAVSRVAGADAHVAVGIGLNVRRPADEAALAAIVPPPRFLSDRAAAVAREPVLVAILLRFAAALPQLDEPEAVARAWEARAGVAGTRYAWRRDDGRSGVGEARRLGAGGTLVVDDGAGETELDLADVRIVERGL